jgi:hypothetical protein
MIKRIISAVIISFLFCTSLYALGYDTEKGLMDDMSVIMETYNEKVGAATCSKDFIAANNEFAEQISALAPKMMAMSEKHPEWGNNPPEEVSLSLQRYAQAAAVAFGQSLQQTIMFASEHPDDTALQESLMNITQAFGAMQGKE